MRYLREPDELFPAGKSIRVYENLPTANHQWFEVFVDNSGSGWSLCATTKLIAEAKRLAALNGWRCAYYCGDVSYYRDEWSRVNKREDDLWVVKSC